MLHSPNRCIPICFVKNDNLVPPWGKSNLLPRERFDCTAHGINFPVDKAMSQSGTRTSKPNTPTYHQKHSTPTQRSCTLVQGARGKGRAHWLFFQFQVGPEERGIQCAVQTRYSRRTYGDDEVHHIAFLRNYFQTVDSFRVPHDVLQLREFGNGVRVKLANGTTGHTNLGRYFSTHGTSSSPPFDSITENF